MDDDSSAAEEEEEEEEVSPGGEFVRYNFENVNWKIYYY
jgi:hypothetical protein